MSYANHKTYYDWNAKKNERVILLRGVSFEDVIVILEEGELLDILEHPNQKEYAHQKIYVVEIRGYAYLVPFVEEKDTIFLKTIIPSRKAHKQYLGGE